MAEDTAPAPTIEPRLVPVGEAARALGISERTLYTRIAEGRVRSVKLGGRRLIPVHELDRIARDEAAS